MKILLTGASSFTGYWFVTELVKARHSVVSVFQRCPEAYEGERKRRVEGVLELCRSEFECSFGDERFLALIRREGNWDALCHHGANVTDYRSPDFDVAEAVRTNTYNAVSVLESLRERGCRRVMLTGSVFEGGEGAGSDHLRCFSPYGLSKGLTAEVFRYYTAVLGLQMGKFVIPNPFGPHEEPRFTSYLARCWHAGEVAKVNTPAYVRDNIHVSLLAKAYRSFLEDLPETAGFQRLNPSGYVESQGVFARRCSEEMRHRLDLPCELEFAEQTDFPEPRIRVNTDPCCATELEWSEDEAWDELARYYRQVFG
jgi:nucleoside-diphosphate-sugar epimerase